MKRVLLATIVLLAAGAAAGWWWADHIARPLAWQGYVDAEYVRVSPTLTGRMNFMASTAIVATRP